MKAAGYRKGHKFQQEIVPYPNSGVTFRPALILSSSGSLKTSVEFNQFTVCSIMHNF